MKMDFETEADKLLILAQFNAALNGYYKDNPDSRKLGTVAAELIINRIADINYRIPNTTCLYTFGIGECHRGSSLLHMAAAKVNLNLVDILLKKGADIMLQNASGETALHQALKHAFFDNYVQSLNNTLSHSVADCILNVQIQNGIATNPHNKDGFSHFHAACIFNNKEAVDFFLKSGVPVNEATHANAIIFPGYTALHLAAKYCSSNAFNTLLEHGADVNIEDSKGVSVFHLLIEQSLKIGDTSKVNTYKEFAELKKRMRRTEMMINSYLMYFWRMQDDISMTHQDGDKKIAKLQILNAVIRKNVAQETARDFDYNLSMDDSSENWPGYTALHFAAHFHFEIVQILVHSGANILKRDSKGVTPLDLCIQRYRPAEICSILLEQDQFRNIILSDGKTKLLDLISLMDSLDKFEEFLKNLVDVNVCVPHNSPLWPGYTPLHLAVAFAETTRVMRYFEEPATMNPQNFASIEGRSVEYYARIEICLEQGCSVTMKDASGSTPIHLAFKQKEEKAVTTLLEFESDFQKISENPVDQHGLSHFHIACATNNEVFKKFIDVGADVNMPVGCDFEWCFESIFTEPCLRTVNSGATPLHIAIIFEVDNDIVEFLLEKGANFNTKDSYNLTPLHYVIGVSNIEWHEFLEYLIESIENLVDCSDNEFNLSYLHVASCLRSNKVIRGLLNRGADMNKVIRQTNNPKFSFLACYAGFKPLDLALKCSGARTAEVLLEEGADMHAKNAKGITPLQYALNEDYMYGIEPFVSTLKSEKNIGSLDETGLTCLHAACFALDVEWVANLLASGANVNARISDDIKYEVAGFTPLHFVFDDSKRSALVDNGEKLRTLTRLLCNHGADVTIADATDSTPVHMAYRALQRNDLHLELVSLLLNTLKNNQTNHVNNTGLSFFHLASLGEKPDIIKTYLESGVDINSTTSLFSPENFRCPIISYGGFTALHFALFHGKVETARFLLDSGANVNIEDIHGDYPLHIAARSHFPDLDIFDRILSQTADINAKNIWGCTAIEILISSWRTSTEHIELFLKRGVSVNAFNPVSAHGLIGLAFRKDSAEERAILKLNFKTILKGVDIRKNDKDNRNAIHNIVSKDPYGQLSAEDYVEAIDLLQSMGCELDQQDNKGKTALHLAVEFENLKAINGLLMTGADANLADKDNRTAFKYALQSCGNVTGLRPQIMQTLNVYFFRMLTLCLDISRINMEVCKATVKAFSIVALLPLNMDREIKEATRHKLFGPWNMLDIFYELGLITVYPRFLISQRQVIQQLFKSSHEINRQYPTIGCHLMLQYRKALARSNLIKAGKRALEKFNIQLPDLCLENILKFFKHSELQELIRFTTDESDFH